MAKKKMAPTVFPEQKKKGLEHYQKKFGKTYKESPVYKGDVNKLGPGPYAKRPSKNIIDARDSKTNASESAKTELLNKYLRSADPRLTKKNPVDKQYKRGKFYVPRNANDSNDELDMINAGVNKARTYYGEIVGSRVKNVKLDSSPSSFEFFKHTVKNKKGKK